MAVNQHFTSFLLSSLLVTGGNLGFLQGFRKLLEACLFVIKLQYISGGVTNILGLITLIYLDSFRFCFKQDMQNKKKTILVLYILLENIITVIMLSNEDLKYELSGVLFHWKMK